MMSLCNFMLNLLIFSFFSFAFCFQYLKKHTDSLVSREHFSFSPRMPVGDFYEERESPEVSVIPDPELLNAL